MPKIMHSLQRTNPKGERFIGTCFQCGKEGLSMGDMTECPNTRNLTQAEALLVALGHEEVGDGK